MMLLAEYEDVVTESLETERTVLRCASFSTSRAAACLAAASGFIIGSTAFFPRTMKSTLARSAFSISLVVNR